MPRLRVRTGCSQCKKRKKKCDETKPECENCRRLGITCQYRNSDDQLLVNRPKLVQNEVSVKGIMSNAYALSQARDPAVCFPNFDDPSALQGSATSVIRGTKDKEILMYICEAGASILRYPTQMFPASANLNAFRLGFPMASQSPTHVHAILALGAGHRSHLQNEVAGQALGHYTAAVSGLRSELVRSPTRAPSERLCAIAAILSMYELVISTSVENRLTHLTGFYRMVEARFVAGLAWGPFLLLVDHYIHSFAINVLWHFDVTVRDKQIGYLDHVFTAFRGEKSALGREVVGIPKSLTSAIYKLSYLTYKDIHQSPWDVEFEIALKMIQRWSPPDYMLTPKASGLLLSARISHIACMCYVWFLSDEKVIVTDSTIVSLLDEAAILLKMSRIEQRPYNCLSWALVILGLFAVADNHRQAILRPLEALVTTALMKGYQPAVQFLKKVWSLELGPSAIRRIDLVTTLTL